ncbi:ASCH domain-containing protein [Nocardioides houyundeii]|uniref:ASCH domain-containing protein n=1 Tax=Nocardioides houyundeii TaxID=2045452 RepID=UPI000C79164B|nr:ASCH domain-containing protein [Nocardioides houyundeii]
MTWPRIGGLRALELGDDGEELGTIEVTAVEILPFGEVPWEFAALEGEGDADLDEWRTGHRDYWERVATPVDDETLVVCLRFVLVAPR